MDDEDKFQKYQDNFERGQRKIRFLIWIIVICAVIYFTIEILQMTGVVK